MNKSDLIKEQFNAYVMWTKTLKMNEQDTFRIYLKEARRLYIKFLAAYEDEVFEEFMMLINENRQTDIIDMEVAA